MLEILNKNDFDKLYKLIEESFPKDEYRTYAEQKQLLNNSAYTVYVLYDEKQELTAFIAVWDFNEFAYIEHFAVNTNYRNKGIGASILNEISKSLNKMICLEVELPENELACRRIKFYERNNFHLNEYEYIQPPMSKGKTPVPLLIMTYKNKIDRNYFNFIRNTLYKHVFKQNLHN